MNFDWSVLIGHCRADLYEYFIRRQKGGNTFSVLFDIGFHADPWSFSFFHDRHKSGMSSLWRPIRLKNKPPYSKKNYYIRYDHFTIRKVTVKKLSQNTVPTEFTHLEIL